MATRVTSAVRWEVAQLKHVRAIHSGGEGSVSEVEIPGGAHAAFKKYKETTLAQHGATTEAKLAAMVEHPPTLPPGSHQSLVWPRGIVYESGRFVGIVMPLLRGNWMPLIDVVDKKGRDATGVGHWTWSTMLTIARNLALAVATLNNAGAAYGDLNEENIVVSKKGLVTLFDLDTSAFEVNGRKYPGSGFVRDDWCPPEYRTAADPFTVAGDRWALAVEIYLLLMESYRPFAAAGFPGLDARDYVTRGLFPVADDTLRPHPSSPPLDVLPPQLRLLFKRCFRDGHSVTALRPTAGEWAAELLTVSKRIRTCKSNAGHQYSAHRATCPWCERSASKSTSTSGTTPRTGTGTLPGQRPGGAAPPPIHQPAAAFTASIPAQRTNAAPAPKPTPVTAAPKPRAAPAPSPTPRRRSRKPFVVVGGLVLAAAAFVVVDGVNFTPDDDPPRQPPVTVFGPYQTLNTTGTLAVRQQPTTNSNAIGALPPDTSVTVRCRRTGELITAGGRQSSHWLRITDPIQGWVTHVFVGVQAETLPEC